MIFLLFIILGMTLELFSPLLGDDILALHSLINDFGVFSPLLGDFTLTFMLKTWKSDP
jgi:hypothetical protein